MALKLATGLTVSSLAFSQGGHIPKKYSCEGENINPPLEIKRFPKEAETLAIIVEDQDAPRGIFDHWLAWNLSPNEPISENYIGGVSGRNSFGNTGYGGPCPPTGSHRYYFKVYALDTSLDLPEGSDKKQLQNAMQGHIITSGELMAHYKKGG